MNCDTAAARRQSGRHDGEWATIQYPSLLLWRFAQITARRSIAYVGIAADSLGLDNRGFGHGKLIEL